MIAQDLEQILFEELGYVDKPNLQFEPNIEWPNGKAIPDIHAAILLQNGPIAYFSRLNKFDPQRIQQLHKNVWSQSKVPLLFVTLPHELRIYNGFEPTPKPGEELDTQPRLLQHLVNLTDLLTAQKEIRAHLVEANHYKRIYLETGAFWNTTDGRKIDHQNRADHQLVEGMRQMRKLLIEVGISPHIAYTLLGRSIFIRYLEDRGILIATWINQLTNGQANSYLETLPDRQITYTLYEGLSKRFNGDLFPVEPEEKSVTEAHLKLLLSFLQRTNLDTGQLSLWPYNFEYIPIELISNIYDIFLEDQRASGAYYTPLLLADFILEETMAVDSINSKMMVLDPACGSGIFLIGAYRRLIQAWRRNNGRPSANDLQQILQTNIFGVDRNREAVRIAAFSLYLEILNHLTNEEIQNKAFQFPSLIHKNLIANDFFDPEIDRFFSERQFDRIVGNMPWGKGTLTRKASEWLTNKQYTVGGKQAAPAFMLRVPDFCKPDGEIALLVPAKSTILVTSKTHQDFRKRFFTTYHTRAIVNFAPLVYELFSKAISPTIAIFYNPNAPSSETKLIYGTPKPSPLSRQLKAIILDPTDIKFLDRQALLEQPELWKIALWGTQRDAAFIEHLKLIDSLSDQLRELDWLPPRRGFQVGRSDDRSGQHTPEFFNKLPYLPTEKFRPFYININSLLPTSEPYMTRPRKEEIYKGPLVLIHKTNCQAAYVNSNISFPDSITVINGTREQSSLLKWLVCVINSPLTRYYQFMTSTRWAIERATPLHKEYLDMPFLIPDETTPAFRQILHHFDQVIDLLKEKETETIFFDVQREDALHQHQDEINRLVFEIYGLHPVEQQLVNDTLDYSLEFFNWSKRKNRKSLGAKPVQHPDISMLKTYAETFARTATAMLKIKNRALNATLYQNGTPLTVVTFDLVNLKNKLPPRIETKSDKMRAKLRELDELSIERKTPSLYTRRHVRIYDNNQVSLIRPSEQRFWTQSQARVDADNFLAELASS